MQKAHIFYDGDNSIMEHPIIGIDVPDESLTIKEIDAASGGILSMFMNMSDMVITKEAKAILRAAMRSSGSKGGHFVTTVNEGPPAWASLAWRNPNGRPMEDNGANFAIELKELKLNAEQFDPAFLDLIEETSEEFPREYRQAKAIHKLLKVMAGN